MRLFQPQFTTLEQVEGYEFFITINIFRVTEFCYAYSDDLRIIFQRYITQKIKFFIKDFFSKWDQIYRNLRIWSHYMKKSLMGNFIFCVVWILRIIKWSFSNKCFLFNNLSKILPHMRRKKFGLWLFVDFKDLEQN